MAKKKKSKAAADPDVPPVPPPPPPPKEPVDPKWVWPPFPTAPDGVKLVSFNDFVPKGIIISIDDDNVEYDGDGIPTIELLVKHGTGSRRKSKKKKDPLAGLTEEEIKKMTWDKRWELGEDMRTAQPLDARESLVTRFEDSTQLFRQGRPWDHSRQEIWDQWRLYVGLISAVKKPYGKKTPKYAIDDERPLAEAPGLEEEDFSDEDLLDAETGEPAPAVEEEPTKIDPEQEAKDRNEERYLQLLAAQEERTVFWVTETERATKIYFSSYFRDKGLMWLEKDKYYQDGPLLLRFYLQFVLRNRLFHDSKEKHFIRGYEKALVVVERAIEELPYTFKISRAFPEAWAKGCTALWGEICKSSFGQEWTSWTQPAKPTVEQTEEQATQLTHDTPEELARLVAAEYNLGDKAIVEKAKPNEKAEDVDEPVIEEATIEDFDENEPTVDKLADVPEAKEVKEAEDNVDDNTGGWGPAAAGHGDLVGEWGSPDLSDDGWAFAEFTYPTITSFVGPSTIPLKFIPIRAEVSTRILIDIKAPDPSSPDAMASCLATLVLAPWPKPDEDPDSVVRPPQMWDFGEKDPTTIASREHARKFNPTKDNIVVYADPEVMPSCKIGIGIGGAWIQVGRLVEPAVDAESNKSHKKEEWWYMERLDFVVPSYWTVNEQHRDMTRLENNPEYAYD